MPIIIFRGMKYSFAYIQKCPKEVIIIDDK